MKTETQIRIKLNSKLSLLDKLARASFEYERMREIEGYISALNWVMEKKGGLVGNA